MQNKLPNIINIISDGKKVSDSFQLEYDDTELLQKLFSKE